MSLKAASLEAARATIFDTYQRIVLLIHAEGQDYSTHVA